MATSPEKTSDSKESVSDVTSTSGGSTLTDAQRAQMERNRQRALLLRQSRQQARPDTAPVPVKKAKPSAPIDTGGGFFLDPEEEEAASQARKVVHAPGALLLLNEDELFDDDQLICQECDREYLESYLYEKFRFSVCNECRDTEEKHKLITKSQAKDRYLLKDVDIDQREPPLRFIEKKNPHNEHWGRMKLYLESQVIARAHEVWGGEEKIEEERERRLDAKEKLKQKRYDKKVKDLRMAVRSSLWRKDVGGHEHEYGEEVYDEEEDEYSKTCTTCGHVLTYEKM